MKRFVLILPLVAAVLMLNACSRSQTPTQISAAHNASRLVENKATATLNETATSVPILATPSPAVPPTQPATASPVISPAQPATPTIEPSPTPIQTVQTITAQKANASSAPAPAQAAQANPAEAQKTTVNQAAGAAQTPADTSSPESCINKAAFYADVTVPDNTVFDQGQGFIKTWQIRNVGTCAWGKDYALVFVKGDLPAKANVYSMPLTVNSGDMVDISVKMTAPGPGGQHYSDWQIRDNQGKIFGFGSGASDFIWAQIVVNWPVPKSGATTLVSQPAIPSTGACPAQLNNTYIDQLLTLINNARTAQGRNPLQEQDQLMAAAQGHSLDMACNNFASHTGSDNSSWYDRISAQGYAYSYASENIYYGDPAYGGDAAGAFDWWMHSTVHKDNILDPKVSQIGIGYAYDSKSAYGGYYTLDFASP